MSTENESWFKRLIDSIGEIISHLLHGAQNAFNNLPKEQQDAIISGVNVSEILKTSASQGEAAVVKLVADKIGMSTDVATGLILNIGKDLGIDANSVQDVLDHIADKAQSAVTDNSWNALWQDIAKFAASWLSTGSLNWVTLALGVIEFAFQKFVKK